ncbi:MULTISPECIES: crosslink repair DNA glycosylase YcaQ family protein [Microcella]|uniref:winged helix-turn-helix domain-containing protein n=1 Tax=Microcella TaxID=337004 RepID=UPI0015CF5E5E|nr:MULTISPECIES: crosslink repair DNA glycosylase YcaQ family protein [Microcella]MBU1250439.1 winged helix DNA-binding domain-containing protein [Actinomycetota bacterium]MBU1610115.1 winged helix DNA-binding domain-containing protein [Actinomycetota bacterium]MBU2315517.1 winged helix DNA-binding domain-containing protein [Actinomycetota bacterium]MBU2385318.1 winged helix DNA-binding domain-containing protein [Actinomycetota bacterium]QOD94182.1 YcaQ family DNA glycosylase [Chryseoglobus sp
MDRLRSDQARRLALGAGGFARPHPETIGARQLTAALDRLAVLQLDSVNVFARSHYLPLFARLGSYDPALLDRLIFHARGRYTEYWAHEAAIIRRDDWPLWHWKREALREKENRSNAWVRDNAAMLSWLLGELAAVGPMTVGDVEHEATARRGPWWGWSDVKIGLEHLFAVGDVVSGGRRGFSRVYALPEQVGLGELHAQRVARDDAQLELVRRSVRALGVGTIGDIADYHRLKIAPTKDALRALLDAGEVVQVEVEGWVRGGRPLPAFMPSGARIPRRIESTALLSPFDPVVWNRERALRMFGFPYRIEIYTPAAHRQYGYYSLPVLVDDALLGRIDLKSDRQAGVLRVQSAWAEPGVSAGALAERIAPVLRRASAWQGLGEVLVADRGTAAAAVREALRGR